MNIPESEVRFSRLSLVDIGRVFWWRDRLFRAVTVDHSSRIQRLFDSGLVAKLVEDGLLAGSWITSYQLDGYGLVIEHDPIPTVTYPREWSFSMLRDAGKLVLRLNDAARRFGYQTKDCNGYNVLFRDDQPVFVDLGSFVEVDPRRRTLLSHEEFQRAYYRPLRVWQLAGSHLGMRVTPRAMALLLSPEAYLRFRHPLLRLVTDKWLVSAARVLASLRTIEHNDLSRAVERYPASSRALRLLKRLNLFAGGARIARQQQRLARMTRASGETTWSSYHDALSHGSATATTPRFEAIVSRILALQLDDVLEIAGNQGVLSRRLKHSRPTMRVTCTDADDLAIDKGYQVASGRAEAVSWAVFNPFAYESSPLEVPPEVRFRAQAVLALALTHHLTLTQRFRLDYVLEVIGSYAERYVFIEFMPLGLYSNGHAPELPEWYSQAWFEEGFRKAFDLVEVVQLEPNRVLFVGAVRRPDRRDAEVPNAASQGHVQTTGPLQAG